MSRPARSARLLAARALAALALATLVPTLVGCTGDAPSLSWEAFRAEVYEEPDTGVFVFDGDATAADVTALRRAWARHFAAARRADAAAPVLAWPAQTKRRLTYCVSLNFGNRHREVVEAMAAAAADWEAEADVDFVHVPEQDLRCTASNKAVVFDVSPVFRAPYLARAFGPADRRGLRQLRVDDGAFDRTVSFVGLLRHELGHVLGLSHLHARPEAAPCFEAGAWDPPFDTDALSAMVYPSCKGGGDWELSVTDHDRAAVRGLYGAAPRTPPPSGIPSADRPVFVGTPLVSGWLDAGGSALHGPVVVAGLDVATFALDAGPGAALYVRFDERPTPVRSAARLAGGESLEVAVPEGATVAWLLVTAATETGYDLFAPTEGATREPRPDEVFTGLLATDGARDHGPVDVTDATVLRVTLTGTGDPDLYVNFDGRVTDDSFACESIAIGADHCTLAVPPGTEVAWVQVVAAEATSYRVTVAVQ